uniref:Uncharacterized protein n=1 Tax=Globisporangium ultimum (strain ATCC 200006 / CBS 805.95 / DAOM BR144) TaxID=431595 RepID=K3WS73_GLOUD
MPALQDQLDERFARALSLEDAEYQQETEGHGISDEEDECDEGYGHGGDDDDDSPYLRRSMSYNDDSPMSYSESAEITSKKYLERDQVKLALEQEERAKRLNKIRNRRQQIEKWQQKTAKSPFQVNLVADSERLDEEHRLRMSENARRAKELEKRTRHAKNEVILKALTETSDLELLRREKRAIIDEEKRLKALLDLEKTNSHRKLDLIAARNAEKRRRQEKDEYRRRQRQLELEERERRYKQLLKEKLALEDQ